MDKLDTLLTRYCKVVSCWFFKASQKRCLLYNGETGSSFKKNCTCGDKRTIHLLVVRGWSIWNKKWNIVEKIGCCRPITNMHKIWCDFHNCLMVPARVLFKVLIPVTCHSRTTQPCQICMLFIVTCHVCFHYKSCFCSKIRILCCQTCAATAVPVVI